MKITDLFIDTKSLGDELWLVDVVAAYEYKEGRKTQTIGGYRYVIALPQRHLEKISVRIPGKQQMDVPVSYEPVEFENLEIFLYWLDGQIQVGARATGIHKKGEE